MTRPRCSILLALALSAVTVADPEAAADYFPCRSCHGDQGQGSAAIHAPAIAGQSATYIARQLRLFRDGIRGDHPRDTYGRQMALMAANLEDAEIERLATHIAALPPWPVAPAGVPGQPEAVAAYAACAACHGEAGEGLEALGAPRIAGLDPLYIATQLRHFRDGVRGAREDDTAGRQMRAALPASLSDTDIDRLARHIGRR